MANLKRTQREEEEKTMLEEAPHAEYPRGTTIRLETQELNKLGLGMKAVGEVIHFSAAAVVTNVSKEVEDAEDERSMSLQITDMEIKSNAEPSTVERLYGDIYNGKG